MRFGSRMTAAATTGPASGPLPASSHPATGNSPFFIAYRSRLKVGRTISSPNGRRAVAVRLMAAILRRSPPQFKSITTVCPVIVSVRHIVTT